MKVTSTVTLNPGPHTITVGDGGGSDNAPFADRIGGNSSIGSLVVASGGGAGGPAPSPEQPRMDGGSGSRTYFIRLPLYLPNNVIAIKVMMVRMLAAVAVVVVLVEMRQETPVVPNLIVPHFMWELFIQTAPCLMHGKVMLIQPDHMLVVVMDIQ